jgi:hypothetical protein
LKRIEYAAGGGYQREGYVDREQDTTAYSRRKDTATYPYRSHGQSLRSYYALFGCITMALFNGWRSITPFSAGDFIASYISVYEISITMRASLISSGVGFRFPGTMFGIPLCVALGCRFSMGTASRHEPLLSSHGQHQRSAPWPR